MNLNMTKDEFYDLMVVFIIEASKQSSEMLQDPDTIVFTPLFDEFMRKLDKAPMGKLNLAYMKSSGKTKMNFKRMITKIEESEKVRVTL